MNEQIRIQKFNKCLNEYRKGTSVAKIQQMLDVSKSTIYRWISRQSNGKYYAITCTTNKAMVLENKRQSQIIEIYQRTALELNSPIDKRIKAIADLNGQYSLNMLCSTLGVAKATYYRAVQEKHETTYDIKRKEMTPIIRQLFNESKQTIGAAKITALLHEQDYKISSKLVADIMHRNGLFSIRSGAKKLYMQNRERMQNILQQQFTVSCPNAVWVSDVTEIQYKRFKYYICVILDLFARKIVSFHISTKNSAQLVSGAFKNAYGARQPLKPLMYIPIEEAISPLNHLTVTYRQYMFLILILIRLIHTTIRYVTHSSRHSNRRNFIGTSTIRKRRRKSPFRIISQDITQNGPTRIYTIVILIVLKKNTIKNGDQWFTSRNKTDSSLNFGVFLIPIPIFKMFKTLATHRKTKPQMELGGSHLGLHSYYLN